MLPLRAAIKSLRRNPGFATVSILSLALALGLVAAVFGVVDALRNPVTATFEPERLFHVRMKGEGAAGRITAAHHMEALERNVRSSESIAYQSFARGDELMSRGVRLTASGELVSGNYFSVLGVRPVAGRLFSPTLADEDAAGSVVISERVWRSLFDAEPRLDRIAVTIQGETEGRRVQVIGVVPDAFSAETHANYWLALPSNLKARFATERYLQVVVRLRRNATIESLNADFKSVTDYLTRVHGQGRIGFVYTALPMTRDPLRIDEMIWLLVGAAIAVLVVACSNLANLVLARGLARQRDMAVRLSLGARRRDIVNSVLAECLVVALAGAALGILASTWGWSLVRGTFPEHIPTGGFAVEMNWRVVAMSSGAAAISALLFGLLPALRLSDVKLAAHLKENSGANTARRRTRFPVLVIGQVALSLAMLTGVALLLRASQQVSSFRFGFDPARLLAVNVGVRSPTDTSEASRLAMYAATETRLRVYPETESVAWESGVSIMRAPVFTGLRADGSTRELPKKAYAYVSPNYLRTIGIPVIRGRDFEDRDAFSEGVLVIDSVTALKIWGSEDPIGKLAKFGFTDRIQPWFRVIGVTGSIRNELPTGEGAPPTPKVYMVGKTAYRSPVEAGVRPLISGVPTRQFIVRAKKGDIAQLRARIPGDLRAVLPPRGAVTIFGFDDQRQDLIRKQRLLATVFGAFGILALSLCAVGLYSVLSYTVTQRMREHGIRVALGATSRQIFADVLHDGAILVIAGTAVGGFVTLWTNKFVDPYIGMMYHIDVWALVAAEAVLIGVALLAMLRPALRATRTDPVEVLRSA